MVGEIGTEFPKIFFVAFVPSAGSRDLTTRGAVVSNASSEDQRKPMSNKQPIVRTEVFGKYTIVGKRGRDDLGNAGWEITAYVQSDIGHHDYWISRQTFHLMRVIIPVNGGNHQMEILRVATLVDPEERKAVLGVIELWERPLPTTSKRLFAP
jgi:hypothetical protein